MKTFEENHILDFFKNLKTLFSNYNIKKYPFIGQSPFGDCMVQGSAIGCKLIRKRRID